MKIIKFIKKNYKKLIIQFVSIISAFVIFAIPCMAESSQQVIDSTQIYFTDYDLRYNVNETSWGSVYQSVQFQNVNYYTGDSLSEYIHTGKWAQILRFNNDNSLTYVPWNNSSIVVTFLLPETINIKANHSYSIDIPLTYIFGDNVSNYNLQTNQLRVTLWEDRPTNPNFTFYSTDTVIWSHTYYKPMERQHNKIRLNLSNSSKYDYNVNLIRIALRVTNDSYCFATGGLGISDNIIVTDNGKVYKQFDNTIIQNHNDIENQIHSSNEVGLTDANNLLKDYNFTKNIGNGLLAVTNIFNIFSGLGWFGAILQHSLILGTFAFILGMSVMLSKVFRKK